MHTIVFVADDLGVSAGVNRGIARAAAAGLVREASLCVTGTAVADGVRCARDHGLGIGLHLSLTLGTALTGRIAGLTDREGRFRRLPRVLLATLLGRIDRAAVAREVEAQLAALQDLAVQPTHLNGHHHVHVMPVVREVAFQAAAAAGVRWTRLPREHGSAGVRPPAAAFVGALCGRAAACMHAAGMQALAFVGMTTEGRDDFARRAERIAARLPDEPIEWMVHPREPDAALAAIDHAAARRPAAAELQFLADPTTAARLGLRAARFADLEAPARGLPRPGS